MSSTDPDPADDPGRRKFDDIASLFGTIVPPAGTPVRPESPLRKTILPQVAETDLNAETGPGLAPPAGLQAPPPEPLQTRLPPEPFLRTGEAQPVKPPKWDNRADQSDQAPAETPPAIKPPGAAPARSKLAAAIPWPDAFAPRPNFQRTPMSRLWYWLFLIPFALVLAVAVTLFNPRSIRDFVDQRLPQYLPAGITNFFHRTPSPIRHPVASAVGGPTDASAPAIERQPPSPSPTQEAPTPPAAPPTKATQPAIAAPPTAPAVPTPVAPSPVAPSPVAPTPVAPTFVAPVPTTPAAATPAAAPTSAPSSATASEAPPPTPPDLTPPTSAQPTPPPPNAPAVANSAPAPGPESPTPKPGSTNPAAPTAAPAAEPAGAIPLAPTRPSPALASTARVVIYYRRNKGASETEARRIATKLGNVEVRPLGRTARSPTILYSNLADRDQAASLARTLANGGSAWIIRASRNRSEADRIDILLP